MIFEFRTYTLKVGTVGEVIKRFAAGYENRKKLSKLAAFWYTDIGPLNQITHVWPYESLGRRAEIRAEAIQADDWPPKIAEFLEYQESEIMMPLAFAPALEPGKHGPFYEMRSYIIAAGSQGENTKRWEAFIGEREKRSAIVGAFYSDLGRLNKFIHIWPYASLDERFEIRKKAAADGIWPPRGGKPGSLISQANKIMLPADFSPMQ